jgi:paraquat-inducible protein B
MNRERRIGLWIVAAGVMIALFVIGIILAGDVGSLKYTIVFDDAKDLKKGDRVQIGGVDIGVVQDVHLHTMPTRVDVRVKIDPEHADKVRADATAIIESGSLINVSGQKIVRIVNSEVTPPYEPMKNDAVVEGMDGVIELKAWQLKKTFEGSKEAWVRRVDMVREGLKNSMEEIKEFQADPRVKEVLEQLGDFLARMRKGGADAVKELLAEWEPLKEKLQPVLENLREFGRQYIVDQIKRIVEQVDQTLQEWRKLLPDGGETPEVPADSPDNVPEASPAG